MNVRRRRVGLVLGAGGPVGHAYHAGLLSALEEGLGWDARNADVVVGTSAGAQVGALLRAGLSPSDMKARVTGEQMTEEGAAIARHYTRPPRIPSPTYPRRLMPSSPSYIFRGLTRPWEARPGRMVAALLPPGRVCLRAQAEGLQRLFGDRWPKDPLWITAVDIAHGHLVPFGRKGAPRTDVGTAVTCSGAVPSVCAPVKVGASLYVDGGIASATNLHLMEQADVDVVLVSSPLSSIFLMRWLFRLEVRRLVRRGVTVIAFEPDQKVKKAMGLNPMKTEKSAAVAETAHHATLEAIDRLRLGRFLG